MGNQNYVPHIDPDNRPLNEEELKQLSEANTQFRNAERKINDFSGEYGNSLLTIGNQSRSLGRFLGNKLSGVENQLATRGAQRGTHLLNDISISDKNLASLGRFTSSYNRHQANSKRLLRNSRNNRSLIEANFLGKIYKPELASAEHPLFTHAKVKTIDRSKVTNQIAHLKSASESFISKTGRLQENFKPVLDGLNDTADKLEEKGNEAIDSNVSLGGKSTTLAKTSGDSFEAKFNRYILKGVFTDAIAALGNNFGKVKKWFLQIAQILPEGDADVGRSNITIILAYRDFLGKDWPGDDPEQYKDKNVVYGTKQGYRQFRTAWTKWYRSLRVTGKEKPKSVHYVGNTNNTVARLIRIVLRTEINKETL